MLTYPNINPVALQVGPLAIHWYGLMYLIGFVLAWALLNYRIKTSPRCVTSEQLSDLLFYCALGVIIGGRVGYVLFYNFDYFLANPFFLFEVWKGGMSFHGGLLGVIIALWFCSIKMKVAIGDLGDFIAPAVPLGLAAGRLGNFINGELWGRVTTMPWGMVFPNAGDYPRHPSQLYEFFLEGVVLFLVLWIYSQKPRPRYAVSSLFLIGYGICRTFVECFREPDIQVGYLAGGWFTEGQLLSIPMIVIGVILFILAQRSKVKCKPI